MNTNNAQILNDKYNNDFNTALDIYENAYSHKDLIELLKNGSIPEKQAATLKLDSVNSEEEAKIIMKNLTGCDGKIREAVSFRLKEFIPQNPQFYTEFQDIILDALIDINGNICRNILFSIQCLKSYPEFYVDFCKNLIKKINPVIEKVGSFDIQDGKYKINKEVFKLYWYLETIYEFCEFIEEDTLTTILSQTKNIQDYTIREKTAKILSKIQDNKDLLTIKQELKNDANYYVRRY